ncbi:unnamed protein product, partial [Staurois parvus]
MSTDSWHCWGYTDHQGTLIISALMITVSVTAREERNADNTVQQVKSFGHKIS